MAKRKMSFMEHVIVNGQDIGVAPRGNWDAAMSTIVDFAVEQYRHSIGEANSVDAMRSLALDSYASALGCERFPILTTENSKLTERGFVIHVGPTNKPD